MAEIVNPATLIHKSLPPGLLSLARQAGEIAERRGQGLYVVGGVVRDLLLGRTNLDLDLVVEGDAPALAGELAQASGGRAVVHRRFGTAKLRWSTRYRR